MGSRSMDTKMYRGACHAFLFLLTASYAVSSIDDSTEIHKHHCGDVINTITYPIDQSTELDQHGDIKPEYLKKRYESIPRHEYGFLGGLCYAPSPAGGMTVGPEHGDKRCPFIPNDDYVKDLDEFLNRRNGYLILKRLLGNKVTNPDNLKRLRIYKVPNGTMLEYVTGSEHISRNDFTLFVLVSDIKTKIKGWNKSVSCSYKIICRDYNTLHCSRCNKGVPDDGEVELWYSGEQVKVGGKRYNIYTIFGTKVLNVAGDLIIPYDDQLDNEYPGCVVCRMM